MTKPYLPQTTGSGQIAPTSTSGPALPFTTAGRVERATRKAAYTVAAQTYLDVLKTDGQAAVGRAKVAGALELEQEALVGTARLGNTVSDALANSSALAQQLVSEVLVGTSGRIQRVLDNGARRIENA